MSDLPDRVNILGKVYEIAYVDNPSEVDLWRRESLWGQIDFWTRTIRVYTRERVIGDVLDTLIHEILHALASDLKIKILEDNANHDQLSILAMGLADVLWRNSWVTAETLGKKT